MAVVRVEEAYSDRDETIDAKGNVTEIEIPYFVFNVDDGSPNDDEDTTVFAFDTGGGTKHINQSLKTDGRYPNTVPDFALDSDLPGGTWIVARDILLG